MNSVLQVGLTWWNTWQERPVNRRIFAAMAIVGGVTTLVKLAAAFLMQWFEVLWIALASSGMYLV